MLDAVLDDQGQPHLGTCRWCSEAVCDQPANQGVAKCRGARGDVNSILDALSLSRAIILPFSNLTLLARLTP